jgi:hypothetical protein
VAQATGTRDAKKCLPPLRRRGRMTRHLTEWCMSREFGLFWAVAMGVRWTDPAIGHLTSIYEVRAKDIYVLAVVHGAQPLPLEPPGETGA